MAEVVFKNVVKAYGNVTVVPELNLKIEDGRFTVLVGPSGCGKSTTLRMIAGLEEITSGELFIGDRVVNRVLPRDRDIAMVFQSYALYPHMTVRENMSFGLKLRKMATAEINKRVDEVAKMLAISEYLDRRPKALSGGQRQRVAMGRAIVRRPSVFLFDEPLSNLDAKLRGEMRREIAKLHQSLKTTIVYVTHDQVEAMTLADTIVVMEKGIIRQMGEPLELYGKPANKFVAGFIGSPTMNFIPCSISDGGMVAPSLKMKIPDEFDTANQKDVILGIRPENVEHTDKDGDGVLSGIAEIVEPLGAEILVTVKTEAGSVMAGFEPTFRVKVGDKLKLRFPPDKIHIFNTETSGNSLRRG